MSLIPALDFESGRVWQLPASVGGDQHVCGTNEDCTNADGKMCTSEDCGMGAGDREDCQVYSKRNDKASDEKLRNNMTENTQQKKQNQKIIKQIHEIVFLQFSKITSFAPIQNQDFLQESFS